MAIRWLAVAIALCSPVGSYASTVNRVLTDSIVFSPTEAILEHCIERDHMKPYCFLGIREDSKLTLVVARGDLDRLLGTPWRDVTINRILSVPTLDYFDIKRRAVGGFLYETKTTALDTPDLAGITMVGITAWGKPAQQMQRLTTPMPYSQMRNAYAGAVTDDCFWALVIGTVGGAVQGAADGAAMGGVLYGEPGAAVGLFVGLTIGGLAGGLNARDADVCTDSSSQDKDSQDKKPTDDGASGTGEQPSNTSEGAETIEIDITEDTDVESPVDASVPVEGEDTVVVLPNPEDINPQVTPAGQRLGINGPMPQLPQGGIAGLIFPVLPRTVGFRIRIPHPRIQDTQIVFPDTNTRLDSLPVRPDVVPNGNKPGSLVDPPRDP